MRIPTPELNENLVGKVCVNSIGRVGVVTTKDLLERDHQPPVPCWFGMAFDGKGTWTSTNPCVVAESAEEFRDKLETRFGGSMSYNS